MQSISLTVVVTLAALIAPSFLFSNWLSNPESWPLQRSCATRESFEECSQQAGCNWCHIAAYPFGIQKSTWGSVLPSSTQGGQCFSTRTLHMSLENLQEQQSGFSSEFPGEVLGCFKRLLLDNGNTSVVLNYEIEVCRNIPYISPRPNTWYTPIGDRGAYGVTCYRSKREFLNDKSWCLSPQTSNVPAAVQGLWWINVTQEPVIAFCGAKGAWDAATNTLYFDHLWGSCVFEDNTFGRHSGERMRKLDGQLKIHFEFENSSRLHVRKAYIISSGPLWGKRYPWKIDYMLQMQSATMIPSQVEENSLHVQGLGSSEVFDFRQLYDEQGSETSHVHAFLYDSTQGFRISDKVWRYTRNDSSVDFDSFWYQHLEIAFVKSYEIWTTFGREDVFQWINALRDSGLARFLFRLISGLCVLFLVLLMPVVLSGLVLSLLPEVILEKVAVRMSGTRDIYTWQTLKEVGLHFWYAWVIDSIGNMSYTIPFFGELSDIIWAPISAWAVNKIFKSRFVASVTFFKEITYLDAIPTAMITWFVCYLPLLVLWLRRLIRMCLG